MPDLPNVQFQEIDDKLYLITLLPPMAGFESFISVWLNLGPPAFIVDTGPAVTAGTLIQALGQIGVSHLDFILLTHIHLDHAGAVGHLTDVFPSAPIVCHPKALKHVIDPEQLWAGSLGTLGHMAAAYEKPRPVPRDRLMAAPDFQAPGIEVVLTPGHAPHHISFQTHRILFAGETCGALMRLPGGAAYLRPATPPRFFLDAARSSLKALLRYEPGLMAFGHYGAVNNGSAMILDHLDQLDLWEQVVLRKIKDEPEYPEVPELILDVLLEKDPRLLAYQDFGPDLKERERFFLLNSIKGFVGDLVLKCKNHTSGV